MQVSENPAYTEAERIVVCMKKPGSAFELSVWDPNVTILDGDSGAV